MCWKLYSDICNKEDELDELYGKFHEAEADLATMRHKRSLMKIYLKKLKEMADNISLLVSFGGAYWGEIQYGRVSAYKESPRCDMLAGCGDMTFRKVLKIQVLWDVIWRLN